MVMPSRSSSGLQSIRRELQNRRPKPLAPKNSAAKKPSVPPPPAPREGASTSKSRPGSAGTHASRPTVVSPSTPPPSRSSAPSSPGSVCPSTLSGADEHLSPGTAVGVRTRTTTLKTGEALVLWLRAMIVSRTDGGYEVVYGGNWPPGDPYGTVHVPRRHVRMIEPSPSPTISPPSSASIATAPVTAAPRPTTAGKSLRLSRSLSPEMEHQARAALPLPGY